MTEGVSYQQKYTPPDTFGDSIVYGAIATGNRLFRFAARRTALKEGAKCKDQKVFHVKHINPQPPWQSP